MAQGMSTTSPGPFLFLAAPLVLMVVVVVATVVVVVVRRPPLPLVVVVVVVVPIPLPSLPRCLRRPVVVPRRCFPPTPLLLVVADAVIPPAIHPMSSGL